MVTQTFLLGPMNISREREREMGWFLLEIPSMVSLSWPWQGKMEKKKEECRRLLVEVCLE